MMEMTVDQKPIKIKNDFGNMVWEGVKLDTPFDVEMFEPAKCIMPYNDQWVLHTNLGSLTVLYRLTGGGWWDTETGFRGLNGDFYCAAGHKDVRESGAETIGEAIDWVKTHATFVYIAEEN